MQTRPDKLRGFWTRFLTIWCSIFLLLHVVGLSIMSGTQMHWWVYQNTRFTPGWVYFSEVPFYIMEPGFTIGYFFKGSSEEYLTLRDVFVILLSDATVWLLPAILLRAVTWRRHRPA